MKRGMKHIQVGKQKRIVRGKGESGKGVKK